MYTLGINAVYHDPAACLIEDGHVVAAAEEERFTRIKHGKRPIPFSTYELPFHAIAYCLREAGITLGDVEHIAYSYDPYLLPGEHREDATITLPLEPSAHPTPEEWESAWDPLFLSSIVNAPRHLVGGVPHYLQEHFDGCGQNGSQRWHFVEHHLAHAASAYLASPFDCAAVLTIDGRGEKATTMYLLGLGSHLERLDQVNFPHSLGMLYEDVTEYLGFLRSSDEYKVMALASYGAPQYLAEFFDMIALGPEGQYTIEHPLRLEERLGPARNRGEPLERRHYDIAHSLQMAVEKTVLELVGWLHEMTGAENLCLAGGVALNCVLNARLRDIGPFERIWVQPAAGDAGTALGAALLVDSCERRVADCSFQMDDVFFGPEYSDEEIETLLRWAKLPYRRSDCIAEEAATLLADEKVIAWFQGRMEFGPRALGARSILASPIPADMQERLNDIKGRESFRPVAPVVLEEEAGNWFTTTDASPFMLFVCNVRSDKIDRIPAAFHTDGTARIQTINRRQHAAYYDLLEAFQARTGVPVLINTSFNTRGEPIVCTPRDAIECFWSSPLDALVIGSYIVEKEGSGV